MERPISTMALLTPKLRVTGKSMPQGAGWGAGAERALTQASSPVWCMLVFFRYITIFCKPFCGRGWKMRISIAILPLTSGLLYAYLEREAGRDWLWGTGSHRCEGWKAPRCCHLTPESQGTAGADDVMMWIPVWGQEKMTWDDPAHQRRGSSFFHLVTVNP